MAEDTEWKARAQLNDAIASLQVRVARLESIVLQHSEGGDSARALLGSPTPADGPHREPPLALRRERPVLTAGEVQAVPTRREETSYCALPLEVESAIAVGAGTPAVEITPPASLLNYCIWRLGVSAEPFKNVAFRQLLLLLTIQQVLMAAFVTDNEVSLFKNNWMAYEDRTLPLDDCVLSHTKIHSVPSLFAATSLAAMVLVMLRITQEDLDFMRCRPSAHEGIAWKIFLNFVWFLQAVYLPGCFAVEAVTMFAESKSSLGVVMETLAVTFIMDIDNMLYQVMLTCAEKREYAERSVTSFSSAQIDIDDFCAWTLMTATLFLTIVHFVHLRCIGYYHSGLDFEYYWGFSVWTSYVPIYGIRGSLLKWRYHYSAEHTVSCLWKGMAGLRNFIACAAAGLCWYQLTVSAAVGCPLGDPVFNAFKECAGSEAGVS